MVIPVVKVFMVITVLATGQKTDIPWGQGLAQCWEVAKVLNAQPTSQVEHGCRMTISSPVEL